MIPKTLLQTWWHGNGWETCHLERSGTVRSGKTRHDKTIRLIYACEMRNLGVEHDARLQIQRVAMRIWSLRRTTKGSGAPPAFSIFQHLSASFSAESQHICGRMWHVRLPRPLRTSRSGVVARRSSPRALQERHAAHSNIKHQSDCNQTYQTYSNILKLF